MEEYHRFLLANLYPRGEADQVKRRIGGKVDQPAVNDTCAVRMSRTLNYSGIAIPPPSKTFLTVSGADHRWYAIRMQELKQWLYHRLGNPQIIVDKPAGDDEKVRGYHGIIAWDIRFGRNADGQTRALGHLDLWDGSTFIGYREMITYGHQYFSEASKVVLWMAP